jgi:hypothetical protein
MSEWFDVFRLKKLGVFAVATVLYMLLSVRFGGWSPITDPVTDGAGRIFFFACGLWAMPSDKKEGPQ